MARATEKSKGAAPHPRKRARDSHNMPRIARTIQRLGRLIPDEELRRFPKDLSSQVDHYVYGTPNR